jgi:hypothetical protein
MSVLPTPWTETGTVHNKAQARVKDFSIRGHSFGAQGLGLASASASALNRCLVFKKRS